MPGIATRNGHPAYLNAPPRKTQAMVNLDRRMRAHVADVRALAADAKACDQPGAGIKGAIILVLAIAAWLVVAAAVYAVLPA